MNPKPIENLKITVYSPESALADPRRLTGEMAQELMSSWELALAIFRRDMMAQFRQSALGYAWLFFPPIATTAVWIFLNRSGVVRVADTGMPYPLFVMIGTLLWQAFLDSLTKPINALNAAKPLLTKLNFPRIAPVIAGFGETLLTSAIRLVVLIPIFVFLGIMPAWTSVFFIFPFCALILLGTALGSFLTPIGLLYSDVGRAVGVLGQFAMYATPVVYPLATLGLLGFLNRWNPVTYLIETGRSTIVGGPFDYIMLSLGITMVATILLLLGWAVFHITIPRIIERMGM